LRKRLEDKKMARRLTQKVTALSVASLLFFILCFPIASTCSHDGAATAHKTFLWKVQSKTNIVYLLGSIHFMKREAYPLNRIIESAYDKSDVLVVEANINDIGNIDIFKLAETAFYAGDDSLEKHISAETYGLLQKESDRFGLPPWIINKQKPWFLALTLTSLQLVKSGFDPNYGIDVHFLSKAPGKKKIKEIESIDYQIGLLSGFSDSDQEAFLRYTLNELHSLGKEADRLMHAWKTGNTEELESIVSKSINQEIGISSVYEKLIYERNRNMASKIGEFLETKETHFIIVGAGHLVGNKGIINMLRQRGYRTEQL
jgi:uncharacterized protein YbaP (TraB family)